jgi:protein-S-isoprenylcysteine O-methyltransferase Ste14
MASKPPPSVTSFGLNMVGVLAALIALYAFHEGHLSGPGAVLAVCAAGVVPIVLLDVLVLRVHRRASTGLDWDKTSAPSLRRVATKLVGLAVTVGPIALAYWVFPEYGEWYGTFWSLLRRFGPALAVFAVLYTWIVDGQMRDPHDAYWQLGRVMLLHPEDARRADIANHYRGWLIKAFYLPLFVVFTHGQLNGIITYDLSGVRASNLRLFHFLTDLIYALDVLYATVGYILSSRLIDTHLRTAEPTMFGWAVALECYMPFWGKLFAPLYLHYEGIGFETWLAGVPTMRWVWAAVILVLEGIYLLATFAFGVRFSNLTNRGILTNGPYRYTKHPAYIAKNLSWWMITLPFIPNHGWVDAVKWSLGLAGVSTVYFLRAKTEERHLSKDPAYVEYALWMKENGWLRFLDRVPLVKHAMYHAPKVTPPPVEVVAVVAVAETVVVTGEGG